MKPLTSRKNGFSLIEMVVAIIVLGILAAAISPIAYTSLRAYDETVRDIVVLDKLRYATERLAREIREVNYDPDTGFAFASGGMELNSIRFTRTFFNSSGDESSPATEVIVTTADGAVTLAYSPLLDDVGVQVPAQVLTDELGSLVFSYLDADGNATTFNTAVRSVVIVLTLSHNNNPYSQTTRVELKRYTGP